MCLTHLTALQQGSVSVHKYTNHHPHSNFKLPRNMCDQPKVKGTPWHVDLIFYAQYFKEI